MLISGTTMFSVEIAEILGWNDVLMCCLIVVCNL